MLINFINAFAAGYTDPPAKLPRGVGRNCVSPVMDDRLAFGVQDVPSEAIVIYP